MRYYIQLLRIIFFVFIAASADAQETNNYCGAPFQEGGHPFQRSAFPTTATGVPDWAAILDWWPSKNLCRGYFYEPPYITAVKNPGAIGTTNTTVTSTGPVTFSQTHPSTLEGNVVVSQPGREITADKALLYRNQETGKINRIDLVGNVHYREAGKSAAGQYSQIDLENKTLTMCNGAYSILRPYRLGNLYGWGTVDKFYRQPTDVLLLDKATFTTCSPQSAVWHIQAKHMTLNKETGRGVARDAWFYVWKMPLFYTPYANFPIDKRRYSGFLYPSFGYKTESGFIVNIPYYFNLAPNYDDTFTVTPMTNRGVQFSNLFRYLTEKNAGFLQLGFIPYDSEFAEFIQSAPQNFAPTQINQPFLNELANDSPTRAGVAFHNLSDFNEHWSSQLDANYVTDDYYLRDLGNTPRAITTDQLLNQALIKYQNTHWQFQGEVQAYQTLHLIDQTFVSDQYQRLPQLDLSASYPNLPYNLDFEANTEWTNFQHVDDFFTDRLYPTGQRFHLNPQLNMPLMGSSWFFTPSAGLDLTSYSVINNAIVNDTGSLIPIFYPTPNETLNKSRTLPILDVDTGLYMERDFHFFKNDYRQTLEPRLYYLYVPYTNQYDFPLFDTTFPAFSVSQLFRPNRFVGYDRVGDANQISAGLTSRILDGFTGADKIDATIGQIYYFHRQQVCLYPDCSDNPAIGERVSPVTGELAYHPNSYWTGKVSAAYDPNESNNNNNTNNNVSAELRYTPAFQQVFKIGYQFVPNGDRLTGAPLNSSQNNLQRIDLGTGFPLNEHWSVVGDWNYNISHEHNQAYLYGVEYDSCCVALRLMASNVLVSTTNTGAPQYQTNVFLQVMLKGVGTVGNSQAGDALRQHLPGYFDKFSTG